MPPFTLFDFFASQPSAALRANNVKSGTGVVDAPTRISMGAKSGTCVVEAPARVSTPLPRVDGVVVEKARRSIDDDEPSIEVDFLHDLRHIGHQ